MQSTSQNADKIALHFIEADTQVRAELVRTGYAIGHHCEIYADMSELAAHPPRSGLIIVRDQIETGGVAAVLDRLLSLGVWLPVVAMDYQPSPSRIVQAIKDGALDYMVLPLQTERLAKAIAKVSREAHDVSAQRQRVLVARSRLSMLTGREREVLEALSGGGSNKQIARTLSISPRTVEIHRANMMNKLGARHAAEAIRIKLEAREEQASAI
jgi:two-component system, LuxR family, response regulator FixJ